MNKNDDDTTLDFSFKTNGSKKHEIETACFLLVSAIVTISKGKDRIFLFTYFSATLLSCCWFVVALLNEIVLLMRNMIQAAAMLLLKRVSRTCLFAFSCNDAF